MSQSTRMRRNRLVSGPETTMVRPAAEPESGASPIFAPSTGHTLGSYAIQAEWSGARDTADAEPEAGQYSAHGGRGAIGRAGVDEQDRKSIEANLGKTSDNPYARRVNITVTWSGYNVQWSALMSPASKTVK